MPTDTIDVSHWQNNINWNQVAAAGVKYAWIKCTDGSASEPDPFYQRNITGARAAGIRFGSYHFLVANHDPDEQAERFLKSMDTGHNLLPALDCEWNLRGGVDRWLSVPQKSRIAMIGRFVAHVREVLFGVAPMIYTATSWWRPMIGSAKGYQDVAFGDCPLWIASYTKTPGDLPAPWPKHSIWQYSGKGKVGGIVGTVDLDKLNVPADSLLMPGV